MRKLAGLGNLANVMRDSDLRKLLLAMANRFILIVNRMCMRHAWSVGIEKDASRALAKMSFDEKNLTGDITGLGFSELDALQDWEYKFMSKYTKVGTVKKAVSVAEGETAGELSESFIREVDAANPIEDGPPASATIKKK